jgi:HAD superfamily hydrolase (TIGR01549 family)
MAYSRIKLISFDLDDTLYDNGPVIKRAEQESQNFLRSEFEKQQQVFDYQLFLQYRNELLESESQLGDNEASQYENLSFLRQKVLLQCCLPLADGEQIAEQAFDSFMHQRSQVRIEEEIVSMLEQLNKKYQLVIVTNGNCQADRLSIAKLFSKNYSPELGYRAKPHPQMLNQILNDFELLPDQVLHLGDQPNSDGLAAMQAGCEFRLFAPFLQGVDLRKTCDQLVGELCIDEG